MCRQAWPHVPPACVARVRGYTIQAQSHIGAVTAWGARLAGVIAETCLVTPPVPQCGHFKVKMKQGGCRVPPPPKSLSHCNELGPAISTAAAGSGHSESLSDKMLQLAVATARAAPRAPGLRGTAGCVGAGAVPLSACPGLLPGAAGFVVTDFTGAPTASCWRQALRTPPQAGQGLSSQGVSFTGPSPADTNPAPAEPHSFSAAATACSSPGQAWECPCARDQSSCTKPCSPRALQPHAAPSTAPAPR